MTMCVPFFPIEHGDVRMFARVAMNAIILVDHTDNELEFSPNEVTLEDIDAHITQHNPRQVRLDLTYNVFVKDKTGSLVNDCLLIRPRRGNSFRDLLHVILDKVDMYFLDKYELPLKFHRRGASWGFVLEKKRVRYEHFLIIRAALKIWIEENKVVNVRRKDIRNPALEIISIG